MLDTASILSANGKHWNMPAPAQVDRELVAAAGGSNLLAAILQRRGFTELNSLGSFLNPDKYVPTPPNEFEAMSAAVGRIIQAVEAQEQVTIYGDYDVDGITGTSLLLTVLNLIGAKVDFYIPNRAEEGYGLNLKAVSVLASKRQTKLIITCDCGISNFAEINFAKAHGIDTVVADHHTMPELMPPAVAILHPKLLHDDHPLFHLPGVGVAYKLGEALLLHAGKPEYIPELLDYVTLGMIADMVPLVKENRYLVQVGLPLLAASKRPGIQALLQQIDDSTTSGVRNNHSTDLVGFGLAPRINAVGRLADANIAVQLLTTTDPAVAQKLAQQLELDNKRRQELCQRILEEAERMVEAGRTAGGAPSAIVIYKEGWHHGVVGIVASRLVEKYHCPVFIGELNVQQGQLKGSARGIDALDLHAVLKANANLLNRWGGHKMAAGFSLDADKAPAFKVAIEETCRSMLAGSALTLVLEVDAVLTSGMVNAELAGELSVLAPFGIGNRKPILVMQNLKCSSVLPLGKEQKHVRLFVQDQSNLSGFEAVYWNHKGKAPQSGTELDLAFCVEINEFKGRRRLQLVVVDWCLQKTTLKFDKQPAPAETAHNDRPVPVDTVAGIAISTEDSSSTAAWTDLRGSTDLASITSNAAAFGENVVLEKEPSAASPARLIDRAAAQPADHLLLWSYPPSLEVFAQIIRNCNPRNIYFSGAAAIAHNSDNAHAFLKHLTALIRFAVNKREGKAESSRLAIALGTTDMCIALGLSALKKLGAIDWITDNGILYLKITGSTSASLDTTPEHRQLADSLHEVVQFRRWCATTKLDEISYAVASVLFSAQYNNQSTAERTLSGDPRYVRGDTAVNLRSNQPA